MTATGSVILLGHADSLALRPRRPPRWRGPGRQVGEIDRIRATAAATSSTSWRASRTNDVTRGWLASLLAPRAADCTSRAAVITSATWERSASGRAPLESGSRRSRRSIASSWTATERSERQTAGSSATGACVSSACLTAASASSMADHSRRRVRAGSAVTGGVGCHLGAAALAPSVDDRYGCEHTLGRHVIAHAVPAATHHPTSDDEGDPRGCDRQDREHRHDHHNLFDEFHDASLRRGFSDIPAVISEGGPTDRAQRAPRHRRQASHRNRLRPRGDGRSQRACSRASSPGAKRPRSPAHGVRARGVEEEPPMAKWRARWAGPPADSTK